MSEFNSEKVRSKNKSDDKNFIQKPIHKKNDIKIWKLLNCFDKLKIKYPLDTNEKRNSSKTLYWESKYIYIVMSKVTTKYNAINILISLS